MTARVAETHASREAAHVARERRRYVSGTITLAEFETRVEAILDPDQKPPLSSFSDPADRKMEAIQRGKQ